MRTISCLIPKNIVIRTLSLIAILGISGCKLNPDEQKFWNDLFDTPTHTTNPGGVSSISPTSAPTSMNTAPTLPISVQPSVAPPAVTTIPPLSSPPPQQSVSGTATTASLPPTLPSTPPLSTSSPEPSLPSTPVDFGSNVIIFDPSMSSDIIQTKLSQLFKQQEKNQFGNERYAIFFKPGVYNNLDLNIGFYTHVLGLGYTPDDVVLNGNVHVEANWMPEGNATQNFWRSAENISIKPSTGSVRWAVSQAAPMRRVHVKGDMWLASPSCGWASGGFISDTLIDGNINSCSQQQWFSRNSEWGQWVGGVWNMVFVGDINPPTPATWPTSPYTVITQSPIIREKPFLSIDSEGQYSNSR
jgi:hypothetical protein